MKNLTRCLLVPITVFVIVSCSGGQSDTSKSKDLDATTDKSLKSWTLVGTVDEFGKESGESVIAAIFTGHMSNSATTNALLKVRVQVADSVFYMQFLEYGRQPADMPDSKFINISVRRPNGKVETISQFLFRGYMTDSDGQLLGILFEESEPISIRVEMKNVESYNSAVYVFDMDNSGLRELL